MNFLNIEIINCKICKKDKLVDEFYTNGYNGRPILRCKECVCQQRKNKYVYKGKGKHNLSLVNPRLYNIWLGLRNRCNNYKNPDYKHYGGKGIKVCEEWDNYELFYYWALSHGYKDHLTIDRINNNEGYSPYNCRWVTAAFQNSNKSNTLSLEEKEEIKNLLCLKTPLKNIAKVFEVDPSVISRIKNNKNGKKLS